MALTSSEHQHAESEGGRGKHLDKHAAGAVGVAGQADVDVQRAGREGVQDGRGDDAAEHLGNGCDCGVSGALLWR